MSRKKSEYTPREIAHSIAIDWLRNAFLERTGDLDTFNLSPSATRKTRHQIAKLHNKLLEQSSLDGINIEVD